LMHATLVNGFMGDFLATLPPVWDIRHRSPISEVQKRFAGAVLRFHAPDVSAYNEYLAYFKKKDRAGLVNIQDSKGYRGQLFIMPPNVFIQQLLAKENEQIANDTDFDNIIWCLLSPSADHPDLADWGRKKQDKLAETTADKKPEEGSGKKSDEKTSERKDGGENNNQNKEDTDKSKEDDAAKNNNEEKVAENSSKSPKAAEKRKSPERSPKAAAASTATATTNGNAS